MLKPPHKRPSGLPLPINGGFDHWRLRHLLYLVQRDTWIQTGNEAVWSTFRGGQDARIVDLQVLPVLFAQFLRLNEGTFDGNGRHNGPVRQGEKFVI